MKNNRKCLRSSRNRYNFIKVNKKTWNFTDCLKLKLSCKHNKVNQVTHYCRLKGALAKKVKDQNPNKKEHIYRSMYLNKAIKILIHRHLQGMKMLKSKF